MSTKASLTRLEMVADHNGVSEDALTDDSVVTPAARSVSSALIDLLQQAGVKEAFGIPGGAIGPFWLALEDSAVRTVHFKHESGAAFAAAEASLAGNRPVVVFATTGPGMVNALNGVTAGRWEGAQVVLVSGATPIHSRRRGAFQQTHPDTGVTRRAVFAPPDWFDANVRVESPEDLQTVSEALARLAGSRGGFTLHVCVPSDVQAAAVTSCPPLLVAGEHLEPAAEVVGHAVDLLRGERFFLWLGFGARHASADVRRFVDATNVPVVCTPRGKGVLSEDDPAFVGVTGLGGHASVVEYMERSKPTRALVIGTRLGENSTGWDPRLLPAGPLIHVDTDADAFYQNYADVEQLAVRADASTFLQALIEHVPLLRQRQPHAALGRPPHVQYRPAGRVRPQAVMQVIQKYAIDRRGATVFADIGNAMGWTTQLLRTHRAGQSRVSMHWGSMGYASAGVIGHALAVRGPAVAVVGDGAMLMTNELSTAAELGVDVLWIVLNDAMYGMVEAGAQAIGARAGLAAFNRVDFAAVARGMGVAARTVDTETELTEAFHWAMTTRGPRLLDVAIDETERAPVASRINTLDQSLDLPG
ncbi:thiamine pyrophosphate-binding protein [Kribbella sp. NBC_00359]|uniref:thiamine pyrophosphate-binding protein n=1 Tax=Kribbella sp. NBC_00359 TaxID=2975966 RepID=UPI002E22F4E0